MLILSTALYVNETMKNTPIAQTRQDNIQAYEISAKNAVISALANFTGGGSSDVLAADLAELTSILTSHSYQTLLKMETTLSNTSPYQDGFWVSWNSSGVGVSSACANFVFTADGNTESSSVSYAVNITSKIVYNSTYTLLDGTSKIVNLTVTLQNEDKYALAKTFMLYIDHDGQPGTADWEPMNSTSITDYGNGTYTISAVGDTNERTAPAIVKLYCLDQRGIAVYATKNCTLVA